MPRSSHLLSGCLALAALGLGIIAWRQQAQLRSLAGSAHSAGTGPAPRALPGARLEPGLSVLTPRPLQRPMAGLHLAPEDREALARDLAPRAIVPRPSGPLARLMNDPNFVRALTQHKEGTLDARYAELFRRLNLSDVELARFKQLLVERENVALDVLAVDQESPQPLPPRAVQASIGAAQAQVDEAIRVSLGNERYAMYVEFAETLPQRAVVERLAQRLSYSAAPLQPTQAEALVRVLAQHAVVTTVGVPAKVPTLLDTSSPEIVPVMPAMAGAAVIDDQAIAKSEAILTPPQVEALREIQTEAAASTQAARQILDALPGNNPRPGFNVLLQ